MEIQIFLLMLVPTADDEALLDARSPEHLPHKETQNDPGLCRSSAKVKEEKGECCSNTRNTMEVENNAGIPTSLLSDLADGQSSSRERGGSTHG